MHECFVILFGIGLYKYYATIYWYESGMNIIGSHFKSKVSGWQCNYYIIKYSVTN